MSSEARDGIVIALGGNALTDPANRANGVVGETIALVKAFDSLINVIRGNRKVLISHGNGPQVGNLLLRSELSSSAGLLPPLPLDSCVADTIGGIGYLVGREARNSLRRAGIERTVAAIITTVVIETTRDAPGKGIGQIHEASHRPSLEAKGWTLKEQGEGVRRVVPSPPPAEILEIDALRLLFNAGVLVVAGGGGGVPVIAKNKDFVGVEAVIDKDTTASLLARELNAATLIILTNVAGVYLDFGTTNQRLVPELTPSRARQMLSNGDLGEGSMSPKVTAACDFVENGGHVALICHLGEVADALAGDAGTRLVADTVAA